jgi:density-regulated protein
MTERERLVRFYKMYNADKIDEIDGVLERFRGKEAQLFKSLVKKYGPEPSADEVLPSPTATKESAAAPPPPVNVPESQVVKDFNHARLIAFYQKYNPEKVAEVPTVLSKYRGKEAALFNALVKKYGPEPDDSDDEDDDEDTPPMKAVAEEEEADDDDEEDDEEDDGEEEKAGIPKMKKVVYCPIDTLPAEYCEYGPMFQEAKPWLAEHYPNLLLQKYNRTVTEYLEAERQIAEGVEGVTLEVGGKQVKKKKSKKTEGMRLEDVVITISKSARKARKRLTFITGLDDIDGINMKDTAKNLGKKFACSSSLSASDTGKQQIQLQGDCVTELLDVLPKMFGISEDQIVVSEEKRK